MACFLVSAAEAVVVTAIEKNAEKKEAKLEGSQEEKSLKIPLSRKLKWLTWMLWGGVVMLAFEHIWHGEVTPFFPFLTAMSDPADVAEMFKEMGTVGVSMAVLISAVWAGMCRVADVIVSRPEKNSAKEDTV